MKLIGILTASLTASALVLTSCDSDTPQAGSRRANGGKVSGNSIAGENDAIAAFKTAVVEIEALIKDALTADKPAAGLTKMKKAFAKMQSIKSEELPADLNQAFTILRAVTADKLDCFKGMPDQPAEQDAWFERLSSDPATGERWEKLYEANKAAMIRFREVAGKFGIVIDKANWWMR